MTTVLISSAGRRGQLLECFRESGRALGIDLRIIAVDMRPDLSAACELADVAYAVPRCTDHTFAARLLEICRSESVALVIPTIDTELSVFSAHRQAFASGGTEVVVSSPEVVQLARDKLATTRALQAAGINAPRSLSLAEYRAAPSTLVQPIIAKPVGGSSSLGIIHGSGLEAVSSLPEADYMVQERWAGSEYTVNAFFSGDGQLRCAVPHERIEVRSGEVSKGRTERVPSLEAVAAKLTGVLKGVRGPICFQAIVSPSGEYAVFEINARFGGGYPLAHHAGAPFTQWLLEESLGLASTAGNDWRSGVTMLRYDAAVFRDE